jgi:hypothetical protein
MKPRTFITIWDVQLQTSQTGLIASVGLWVVLALVSGAFLGLSVGTAVIFAFLATLLHWLDTFGHHLGHVYAAKKVGYPMLSVRMWYLLATERYPKDEPTLPAETHIKRALGGPIMSLILALLGTGLVWVLRPLGDVWFYLAVFFVLENFFVFFIGSLFPLGFTDGSTILFWWPKLGHLN